MGPYLSTPNTAKDSQMGSDNRYQFSCCSMQGWRNQQEDSHIAEIKLPNGEALFGVFDGHGGKEVALFVQKKFVEVFKKMPEYKNGNYEEALRKCFITMDDMMDDDKTKDPITEYSL
jgi:serine/threonine protein phosphatase PrpC